MGDGQLWRGVRAEACKAWQRVCGVLRDIEAAVLRAAGKDSLGLKALKRPEPFTRAMAPPVLSSSQCL